MTRVRIVGKEDVDLRHELMMSETSREALSTYEMISTELENTVEVQTASIGSALAFLGDLSWYLIRYARYAEVLEPSVSEDEWLSRDVARKVYNRELEPEETREYFAIRGVKDGEILEPIYTRDPDVEYDIHDADRVIVTRITEEEF